MYVILVYDCGERRVTKMLKLCRRYLTWIQNSVFEGEITRVNLGRLKVEMKEIMDESYDSVIIFSTHLIRKVCVTDLSEYPFGFKSNQKKPRECEAWIQDSFIIP
mgnify:CR=1 FL=1